MRARALLMVTPLGLFSCGDPPPDPPAPPTILDLSLVDAVDGTPVPLARIQILEEGIWHDADENGQLSRTLEPGTVRMRIEAPGYVAEPRPHRLSPSIELMPEVRNEVTFGLQPTDAVTGAGAIRGAISGPDGPVAGALIIASGTRVRATYSDSRGDFAFLGLVDDLYAVQGWNAGLSVTAANGVRVTADEQTVSLEGTASTGVTAGGRVRSGTGPTVVSLVEAQTGAPVPGLTHATNLGSVWSITGVPPGRYQVVAGLELDDNWVLDAQRILDDGPYLLNVETASASLDLDVIPSMRDLSPAGSSTVTATPRMSWRSVADVDFYVVEVVDASGRTKMGGFDASGNPRIRILPPDTSVDYSGDPLSPGARYTWRVFAGKTDALNPAQFEVVAASEWLEGGFSVAAE